MEWNWNKHRFSGGALVFDLINTVVRRNEPALRNDRLADSISIGHFANASLVFRQEEMCHYTMKHVIGAAESKIVLDIREAAYVYFLSGLTGGIARYPDLARLFRFVAKPLMHTARMPFATDVALSASHHTCPDRHFRLKACPDCDWLFLDRSKNGSRIWCDMAVCGNRQKARRSYLRRASQAAPEEVQS
jgi:predicted RNA-binding Zn ribbon-like protein